MKPSNPCKNHPDVEAIGFCHFCHDELCPSCLNEGKEHYYCNKPECLEAFNRGDFRRRDKCPYCGGSIVPEFHFCPSCGGNLQNQMANDLVTVARFPNNGLAHLAKGKLETEGIQAYVADEHMVSINPGYDIAFGGVKVKVCMADAETAKTILGQE